MKRKYALVVAFICLLPVIKMQAQDTLVVSLEKALEIALSESPTIKVANKEIERVDYSKKEKFAALFPTISLGGQYQRALKKQRMFFSLPGMPSNPDGFEVGQDNTYNAGVSASVPIIAPALWSSLQLSDMEAALTLESARASKLSLINQVTKAYYGVLMTQDSYNVFKHSYENTKENARIVKSKFEQGSASEFEWLRFDVQVRNAESNLISAETAVKMSILQLKMLMGMDMFTGLKIEGNLSDFESNMYSDVLSIDTTSIKNNTDLNQFDIKAKQLNHTLKIQKANWWPTLAASFNYAYMAMGNDAVALKWFPTSTAALQLSIPIFQGGSRVYKQKQIKTQIEEVGYQRDNLRRSLELQLMSYMDNIKKALSKIESNKEGLKQADKAMQIAQKRYETGSGTYLDVTNSQLAYIQAGLGYNQAIFDYLSAKADIEKLLSADKK